MSTARACWWSMGGRVYARVRGRWSGYLRFFRKTGFQVSGDIWAVLTLEIETWETVVFSFTLLCVCQKRHTYKVWRESRGHKKPWDEQSYSSETTLMWMWAHVWQQHRLPTKNVHHSGSLMIIASKVLSKKRTKLQCQNIFIEGRCSFLFDYVCVAASNGTMPSILYFLCPNGANDFDICAKANDFQSKKNLNNYASTKGHHL